jgi:hypothetical protein
MSVLFILLSSLFQHAFQAFGSRFWREGPDKKILKNHWFFKNFLVRPLPPKPGTEANEQPREELLSHHPL